MSDSKPTRRRPKPTRPVAPRQGARKNLRQKLIEETDLDVPLLRSPRTGKRGPIKGEGGRPKGPPKVKLSPMVMQATADWLRENYPRAKTINAAASQALDSLSGSNAELCQPEGK